MISTDYYKSITTTEQLQDAAQRIYDDAQVIINYKLYKASSSAAALREQTEAAYCDPSMLGQHIALSARHDSTMRRYAAIRDLADALDAIDRHGYCYYLAKLISVHGKADAIIKHIMREHDKQTASGERTPLCSVQDITMWAINRYGDRINDLLSAKERLGFCKSILSVHTGGDRT